MAGRRETNNPEAHRQGLPWGGYKSPGRNKSKRVVASKTARSESRAFIDKAKAVGQQSPRSFNSGDPRQSGARCAQTHPRTCVRGGLSTGIVWISAQEDST